MLSNRNKLIDTGLLLVLLLPYLYLLGRYWTGASVHAIPSFLSALMAVAVGIVRWREDKREPVESVAVLIALALSVAVYVFGICGVEMRTVVGLGVVGIAATWIYRSGGRAGLRSMWLSLMLLAFVTPMPGFVVDGMNVVLVDVASQLSGCVLGVLYSGLQQDGALLHLPGGGVVEVVEECSGLKGTLLYVPMALGLLHLRPGISGLGAGLLLALAVPLALLANLLRILFTAVLVASGSALQDSHTLHEALGILSLAVGLVILWSLARGLDRPSRAQPQEVAS